MCRKQLVQLELPEQLPEQPGLLELQPVRPVQPVQLERLLQSLI
jgi:hypothetical protein